MGDLQRVNPDEPKMGSIEDWSMARETRSDGRPSRVWVTGIFPGGQKRIAVQIERETANTVTVDGVELLLGRHESDAPGYFDEPGASAFDEPKGLPPKIGHPKGWRKSDDSYERLTYEMSKKVVVEYERQERLKNESQMTKNCRMMSAPMLRGRLNAASASIEAALHHMTIISHGVSVSRGWHDNPREEGTAICLMHSELSEMLEGVRKDTMDDHIPERKTEEVEAADLLIRLLDYCGKRDLDIYGAWRDKTIYNMQRSDHDPKNRALPGGKKF